MKDLQWHNVQPEEQKKTIESKCVVLAVLVASPPSFKTAMKTLSRISSEPTECLQQVDLALAGLPVACHCHSECVISSNDSQTV